MRAKAESVRVGIAAIHFRAGVAASAEPHLVRLVRALAIMRPHGSCRVYARSDNVSAFGPLGPGVEIFVLPAWLCSRAPVRLLVEHIALPILARFHRCDIIHFTGSVAPLLHLTTTIATVHWIPTRTLLQSFGVIKRWYFTYIHAWTLSRADHLIAVSQSAKADLTSTYRMNPDRVSVVEHGVDDAFFRPVPDRARQTTRERFGLTGSYLVAITSDSPYKNLPGLIDAYRRLRQLPAAPRQLAIAGRVKAAPVRTLLRDSVVDRDVILTGYIQFDDVVPLLAGADAMVYLSTQETFGLPILEAMALGIPVVASDLPAIREIAGGAAMIVPRNEPEVVAHAIYKVLTDAGLGSRLRERGTERAKQFTWELAARKVSDMYTLLASRAASAQS